MSIFTRKKETAPKKKQNRRFAGAANSLQHKFNQSMQKINADLKSDLIALTTRARELAKNNETVNSYINLMLRSVLGSTGFVLNCTSYNEDGTADLIANQQIENCWYDYTKSYKKYVSADHQQNGLDFDRHILFNFLVDGEVFIRKVKDPKSPYGIRFQVIDSLCIDPMYNADFCSGNQKIVMGIKVDSHYKPLSYFIKRPQNSDYYLAGERQEVPASEIIHIYKKLYAEQVRGFTPLSAVLLSLNALDQYKKAEINAAILNSAFMGIWEKVGSGSQQYEQEEIDTSGAVAVELQSNVFRYAPEGYKLSSIANNHPNSNVGGFFKAMLKGVSGALGMSYNKVSSDFESTSYSSLRQSNIEDAVTVKEIQQFLIDNWKNVQYAEWLKYLLISDLTNLPYSKMDKFLSHQFIGRNFEYLDPQKEMQAIQMRLALGLSSPIEEIQQLGKDPVDVLNNWQKWQEMLKQRGLKMADTLQMLDTSIDDTAEDKNDETLEEN